MAKSRVRPITPPPGKPPRSAQRVIDAITAYVDEIDRGGRDAALHRATGARHIAVAALQASDRAVTKVHDEHGVKWATIAPALGLAPSTVPDLRDRHRATLRARDGLEETG